MYSITAIILAHYVERRGNLKMIIDDLMSGTVKPDEIIVFIDNPEITFEDGRATIIRSNKSFLPIIRFALGTVASSDYCFFIDDDLTVQSGTLENFVTYAFNYPNSILGLEGSVLGNTETPYSNDRSINRGSGLIDVDVIIRTYFVPKQVLAFGLQLRNMYPELPKISLDDVFLCLGNKYLGKNRNIVIPIDSSSNLLELDDGGMGQSRGGDHYKNRNIVCRFLMDKYAN